MNNRLVGLLGVLGSIASVAAALHWLVPELPKRPEPPPAPAPMPQPPPAPPAPKPPDPPPCPCPPKPWGDCKAPVGATDPGRHCKDGCKCKGEGSPGCTCRGKGYPCSCLACDCGVGATVGGRDNNIQCDLPGELHVHNTGGSDGAGLCVFASMHHAGVWQSDPVFADLFYWMKRHPGGGTPAKVDRMIAAYCQEKGCARPDYVQVEGMDLDILKLACATGRMPGVTYSRSPTGRYGGMRISHMVNLVAAGAGGWWILDNNYPGADKYEKLSEAEFRRVYSPGWAVILLSPPPPPPPHN